MKRETDRLWSAIMKSRDAAAAAPKPSRVSSRKGKGTTRPRVNNSKVRDFMDEHGEELTREAIIDELTNFVDDQVFEGVYKGPSRSRQAPSSAST